MPATTHTPLGATTNTRKWYVDVDMNDGVGTASWMPILGVENLVFNPDNAHLEDDSDYDSAGFQSQTKSAAAWNATLTLARKTQAASLTTYDPGQEKLRTKSIGQFGPANTVTVRIYEMQPGGPRVEAYTGKAAVSWQPQGGAMTALDTVQVTLTGQGALASITHPDTGAAVPTIASIALPGGRATLLVAGGDAVIITGLRFTGTTAVTFGGTAATSFTVQSDGTIAATAPAKTAGTQNLVVTNAAGASAAFPTTYA
jgi:hypothetical protein